MGRVRYGAVLAWVYSAIAACSTFSSGASAGDTFVPLRMEPGLWGFHDGREFGAAGGGLKVNPDCVELSYDFTNAGVYVSGGYHGPFPAGTVEFLVDVTPEHDCAMNHRVGTTDGRCYQGRAVKLQGGRTTTLSVPTAGVAFPEAWGGGQYQGMMPNAPVQAVHLTVGKSDGPLKGVVRLRNPRVRVAGPPTPSEPARGEGSFYLRPKDVVLFIGDATTLDGGYIRLTRERISRTYPTLAGTEDGVRFVNAGIQGAKAADILGKLGELLAGHRPSVAVLCIGVNDCLFGQSDGVVARVREMIAALRAAGKAVTLVTPLAFDVRGRPELELPARALERLVSELKALAATERVLVADCFSVSKQHQERGGEDLSWGDGIHPGERGKEMMAEALVSAWGLGKSIYTPQK